ncbi:MAG TPA: PPK2 family polyphosphate kinase [Bacteroidia bacterium]|jgi:PPK2 family polyphosphate:nucleotide phosphotransferase|nr:PPK2 family polyphosphate kinase [Bacteroidia bacterium]
MNWNKYKIKPNKNFKLAKIDTHPGVSQYSDKELKELKVNLSNDIEEIAKLQNKLFAENRQSLLIILQGMDSAGKDGTIKHIMSGVNPQGVLVHSFKHPSAVELEHDYLWRHAQKLPGHGQITIFNRSYYENVLISKVHPEIVLAEHLPGIDRINKIDKLFWKRRYKQINYFEKNTAQNGTHILKLFLHLSKHEQRNRFIERIDSKEKHWKFSTDDITEREFWINYQDAYEQALKHTSTKIAPWYIIPADDKLYAHLLIGRIILKTLKKMNPSFPPFDQKEKKLMKQAKEKLKKEK